MIARTGATPEVIGVAIEMTQGPVVEALLERGFCVYGINPTFIREEQLRREPQRRSTKAPRRRDQRDARLFKVG